MKMLNMRSAYSILVLISLLSVGCGQSKPAANEPLVSSPSFVLRVQSSYSDIQQVEVSVQEWLFNGQDVRQFNKKETPFDIPFGDGDFSVRLTNGNKAGAEIKLQLINKEGRAIGFLQSKDVCVKGFSGGGFEIENCMTDLR